MTAQGTGTVWNVGVARNADPTECRLATMATHRNVRLPASYRAGVGGMTSISHWSADRLRAGPASEAESTCAEHSFLASPVAPMIS